ncbi:MAG: class I SAM-dependent methyltransferase [Microscillaceae bacterium]|jgi:2-polyprenyl-3-methyl-5-hydroxy-6-metoxy-1,4-benzoquinol methylase|nr:class I SAM-dependent methyltransferase [Microscillaceae bacterium]
MNLLNHQTLEKSAIVANNRMNRERGVVGINSYAKDLKINILNYLHQKIKTQGKASWLDLGCGSGKALVETAQYFAQKDLSQLIDIQGIDLVDRYIPTADSYPHLKLTTQSLHDWQAGQAYDLITAVHSLHYLGDKLSAIQKAVSALTPQGLLLANLSWENIHLMNPSKDNSLIMKHLKQNKLLYRAQSHLLICEGKKDLILPFEYLGADDQAGANYTGQAVVNSYYQLP